MSEGDAGMLRFRIAIVDGSVAVEAIQANEGAILRPGGQRCGGRCIFWHLRMGGATDKGG